MGVRDAAIILLGYASAMRRSELVALNLLDVAESPAGSWLRSAGPRPTRTGTARASPSPAAGTRRDLGLDQTGTAQSENVGTNATVPLANPARETLRMDAPVGTARIAAISGRLEWAPAE
jgi:integrase